MGNTIRLNFGPPKFAVRRFSVARKLGTIFLEIPLGSQLVGIDAPDHNPEALLFFWAVPLDEDRPKSKVKFLIVGEEEPFAVEECSGIIELNDGSVYEEVHTHLDAVGFWTEPAEDGSFRTFHVLELVDDEPVESDTETEATPG